jgi:hypothetical protein
MENYDYDIDILTKIIFVSGFRMKLMCTLKKMPDSFLDMAWLIVTNISTFKP